MHIRTFLFLAGSLLLIVGMLSASAVNQPSITVLQPQAIVANTRQVGDRLIRNYTFVLTVQNHGSAPTEDITFFVADPDGGPGNITLGNCSIKAGESKQVTKTDFPVAHQGAFYFNVTWAPTSEKSPHIADNSGSASFIIGGTTNKKSTPGFEGAAVILSLCIAALLYRKRFRGSRSS